VNHAIKARPDDAEETFSLTISRINHDAFLEIDGPTFLSELEKSAHVVTSEE